MQEIEKKIGYIFKNKEYLETALTHSSYTEEHGMPREHCNQRLEFLGDAVLEMAIREYLFHKFPTEDEGFLSNMKAQLVRSESLAEVAKSLNLGAYLKLGNGARQVKVYENQHALEDAIEALIGAIFCDSNYEESKKIILNILDTRIDEVKKGKEFQNYKSLLQETLQKKGNFRIEYILLSESGMSHEKTFESAVKINGKIEGKGIGSSKKEAEKRAAKQAFKKLKL